MSSNLLALYTSTRSSTIKHLKPCLPYTTTRRLHSQESDKRVHDAEKATSTAEEFERVAEEKSRHEGLAEAKSRQGFASHTVEKFQDGAAEAMKDETKPEKVKEAFKESPETGGNFHKHE